MNNRMISLLDIKKSKDGKHLGCVEYINYYLLNDGQIRYHYYNPNDSNSGYNQFGIYNYAFFMYKFGNNLSYKEIVDKLHKYMIIQ